MNLTDLFIAQLESEAARTRKTLERVPEGKADWKPHANTFSHLAHHRAQLGVYLRLNDIAVPSVYGPSADDQTFA
jgi:hypothetical protein